MKDREFRKRKAGTARTALATLGVFGLAVAAAVSLRAQEEAAGANSQPGQIVTACLDYQEVNYSISTAGLALTKRSEAFKKEPAFSGGRVIRGTLRLGGGASNDMAFAWNRAAGKLYLDLNRNLDLTDDPAGVFSCERASQDFYQSFTNIHLPFRGLVTGNRQALVDLNFYDYGTPSCSMAMRSLWQGKVTLHGEEWQVGLPWPVVGPTGLLESHDLLLRPWSDRNKPFSLYGGSLQAVPFSRKLFVGNHAYQLQCTNEAQGDTFRVRMQFAEEGPKLGELKITGQFVQRVTLEGGPYLVVLDQPGPTVKVPVGRYKGAKVCLKSGEVEAYLDERTQAAEGRITVSEKAPAVLMAGGPLTNSVSINRQGRHLSMNYQLTGVGGAYQLVNQDRSHPPEFAVYHGDKKVASGKFEFG